MNPEDKTKEFLSQSSLDWYLERRKLPAWQNTRPPEEIEYIDADYDQTDRSRCDMHHIGISNDCQIECMECWMLFQGKNKWKMIIPDLQEMYGPEWEHELNKLRETRRLVIQRKLADLVRIVIDLRDKDGTIKTTYKFYRLK